MTTTEEHLHSHPSGVSALHAGVRLVLELSAIAGFAIWGWSTGSGGFSRFVLATVFVAIPATIWALFRANGDTGRGKRVIPVPGWLRLTLEIAIIGLSAYGMWTSWSRAAAETFLTVFALHYAVTWERVRWLLRGTTALTREEQS